MLRKIVHCKFANYTNAQTARNKQVRTQMLNSTVGQTPNTTQQAVKVTTNNMQEDEERR